jgi:TolA-binding protein
MPVIMALLFCSLPVTAQQTAAWHNPDAAYQSGISLFRQQQYAAAAEAFEAVILLTENDDGLMHVNARYHAAVCALELEHADAEYKLLQFIDEHPANTLVKRAYFQLGKYQFARRKYAAALSSFDKVEVPDLGREERYEYYYKKGYSQYISKKLPAARASMLKVTNSKSEYAPQANYYYAVISFEEGDYNAALRHFEPLAGDRRFRKSVNTYLAYIYHHEKDYDKMLEYAIPAYEEASGKDKPGLALLIGDAYYQSERYEEALPYLDFYERTGGRSISREEAYAIAYTQYMNGDCKAAIRNFQQATAAGDALAQNAYYHLGYCYLQTGQKAFASKAFASAYKLGFDGDITEDALFNYAKLSMEISSDPYNTAISALEDYLERYPSSPREEEAYSYLASLYLSTRNYQMALASVERIRTKDPALQDAYQKICFYRGIELFTDNDLSAAISLFKKATSEGSDQYIAAEASYWIGEAFYRQNNAWGAIKYYREFLESPKATETDVYATAFYNLGYTYFNKEDYGSALSWFGKFINYRGQKETRLMADALARMGDCYFIRNDYQSAIKYYDDAIRAGDGKADYALYQKAIAQGASGQLNAKVNSLKELTRLSAGTTYAGDAKHELAETYLLLNNNAEALTWFGRLVKDHPNSRLAIRAKLKTGLIHYNLNQYEKALTALQQVIDDYPGTAEAREALNSIRNIYIDQNKVDEYYAYAEKLPFAEVTVSEQDSITYMSAENLYMETRCEAAIQAFTSYLEKFPHGAFAVNAAYYRAECAMKAGMQDVALESYAYVAGQPLTGFTENSLLQAARLSKDKEDWTAVSIYYRKLYELEGNREYTLEAISGIMDANYQLGNWADAITAAMTLLSNEKVDDQGISKAHYIMARSYMAMNNLDNARAEFVITDKLAANEWGAESKYMIAYINFSTGRFHEAENTIFELSEQYAAYDQWVAKGFLLLSDVYLALGNVFQAKETLRSIIENYRGPDLGEIAAQKLAEIEAEEGSNDPANPADSL